MTAEGQQSHSAFLHQSLAWAPHWPPIWMWEIGHPDISTLFNELPHRFRSTDNNNKAEWITLLLRSMEWSVFNEVCIHVVTFWAESCYILDPFVTFWSVVTYWVVTRLRKHETEFPRNVCVKYFNICAIPLCTCCFTEKKSWKIRLPFTAIV